MFPLVLLRRKLIRKYFLNIIFICYRHKEWSAEQQSSAGNCVLIRYVCVVNHYYILMSHYQEISFYRQTQFPRRNVLISRSIHERIYTFIKQWMTVFLRSAIFKDLSIKPIPIVCVTDRVWV